MPSSRSKVVRKKQPKLTAPSPLIADGATSEADLCRWADWFGQFHQDPLLHVPIALRTVDCEVTVQRSQSTDPPRCLRCIREVAKFNGTEGVEWMLITWVPGLPGMQFQRCASLDEAMSLLDAPPSPVSF